MRFVTWNVARGGGPGAWNLLGELQADVAFVQEAKRERLPPLALWNGPARRKNGTPQPWGSAIISSSPNAVRAVPLSTPTRPWVAAWLARVGGAVVAAELTTKRGEVVVLSCNSPAWAVPPLNPAPSIEEIESVRLREVKRNQAWAADLIWAAAHDLARAGREVLLAGDFNLCVAFDQTIGSGNREYVDRMASTNFTEVVRHFHPDENSTPTFRNARSKRTEHQLDYVWVTNGLKPHLKSCSLGEHRVLLDRVSDHLPVTFEIDL